MKSFYTGTYILGYMIESLEYFYLNVGKLNPQTKIKLHKLQPNRLAVFELKGDKRPVTL